MTAAPMTTKEILETTDQIVMLADQAEVASQVDGWREGYDLERKISALCDGLGDEVPRKLDSISFVIDRIGAEADQLREWELELAAKRRARKQAIAWLKSAAAAILHGARDAEMFVDGDGSVRVNKRHGATRSHWLQTTTQIQCPDDVGRWPEEWIKVKREGSRSAAKKALEAGGSRDGFALIEIEGWRSR